MSDELINGRLLLTVDEAASYLSIGRSHLYGLLMSGAIRSVRLGRIRRVPVYALREFVQRLQAESADEC